MYRPPSFRVLDAHRPHRQETSAPAGVAPKRRPHAAIDRVVRPVVDDAVDVPHGSRYDPKDFRGFEFRRRQPTLPLQSDRGDAPDRIGRRLPFDGLPPSRTRPPSLLGCTVEGQERETRRRHPDNCPMFRLAFATVEAAELSR